MRGVCVCAHVKRSATHSVCLLNAGMPVPFLSLCQSALKAEKLCVSVCICESVVRTLSVKASCLPIWHCSLPGNSDSELGREEYLREFHSWQVTTKTPGVTTGLRACICICVCLCVCPKHDT